MPEECGSTEHIGNPEVLGSTHWLSAKPEHMILKHMIGKLAACFLPPTEHTPMPSLAFVGLFSLSHYLSLSPSLSRSLPLAIDYVFGPVIVCSYGPVIVFAKERVRSQQSRHVIAAMVLVMEGRGARKRFDDVVEGHIPACTQNITGVQKGEGKRGR